MQQFCGYCGFYGEMVFVHSHYQCPRCKNNIMPCCEGENAEEIEENEKKEELKDKDKEKSEEA